MIPTPQKLPKDFFKVHTIAFDFVEHMSERFHEARFPIIDGRMSVLIEDRDEITAKDFSFCRNRIVWIDVTPRDYRRASVLWKELLKPENLPSVIFTHDNKGLVKLECLTQKRTNFYADPTA